MSERWRIKKGDNVIVTTGRDKGKKGEILRVLRDKKRVIVKGVNVVKRHTKPSPNNPGGIVEKELSIHVSNVLHIDPTSGKPTRVGVRIVDGQKVRIAKKSDKQIDG